MATGRTLPTLLPDWGKAWTILTIFVFGWRSASSAGGLAQAFAAGFTSKGALPLSLLVLERQGGAVHPNGAAFPVIHRRKQSRAQQLRQLARIACVALVARLQQGVLARIA